MTTSKIVYTLQSAIRLVFGFVEAILGLRLLLRLFGANSNNDIVSWIYDTSASILQPFENVFPTVRLEDGYVLELSTLFAMLMYAVAALALSAIVAWLDNVLTADEKTVVKKKR